MANRDPEIVLANEIKRVLRSYLERQPNIRAEVRGFINDTLNRLVNIGGLGMGDLLEIVEDMVENGIPVPQRLLKYLDLEDEGISGNGRRRKVGGVNNATLIQLLQQDINNYRANPDVFALENGVSTNHIDMLVNQTQALINSGALLNNRGVLADAILGTSYIIRNPVLRRFAGLDPILPRAASAAGMPSRRKAGSGIFDLIAPIANMFSGHSFDTPLDSIVPKEITNQFVRSVAEAGLGGSRKKSGLKTPSKNPWIAHVKSVASKKGISYSEALKIASKTYKK